MIRVVNWNVQWATPRSRRSREILRRVDLDASEVVCLTETDEGLLSGDGYTICSQADYGYPLKGGRRKIMLWSGAPWERVDDLGVDSMPPGRFVSGVTSTSLGEVTVIGICIPWFGCRTEARRGPERRCPRPAAPRKTRSTARKTTSQECPSRPTPSSSCNRADLAPC